MMGAIKFVTWFTQNSSSFDFLISTLLPLATGTTLPYLTVSTLVGSPFLIPPLTVQRRIAGILSAYDELIENSQRRIRILETMGRTLYREWFVHFRFPGSEKLKRIASALGDIPQGWELKPLGVIAAITMGLSPRETPTTKRKTACALTW